MGYSLISFSENMSKKDILESINNIIFMDTDNKISKILWVNDSICKNYDDASASLKTIVNSKYDAFAIRYLKVAKIRRSKELEELEQKYNTVFGELRKLSEMNYVKGLKINYITCKNCGSKLKKEYVYRDYCPLCGECLLPKSYQYKLKRTETKLRQIEEEKRKEEEKLRMESHKVEWLVLVNT